MSAVVVVTGLGAVSGFGCGVDVLWQAVRRGQDAMRPITRFETRGFSTSMGALVPAGAGVDETDAPALAMGFALSAAREALDEAGIPFLRGGPAHSVVDVADGAAGVDGAVAGVDGALPRRVALVLGTSPLRAADDVHAVAVALGRALGLSGPIIAVSTACTASSNAIGVGLELLRAGDVDAVLAGGVDVLTPEFFAGFCRLGVVAADKCAPFSVPFGTTLGEGAGFLVLEREGAARARGIVERAALLGFGSSGDAFHESSPDPAGAGVVRALRAALDDAGLDPDDVGAVNAHATGTEQNDAAEATALRTVFGERALPVSASKSALGHAQAAAGVLEAIITVRSLQEQLVTPTLRFTTARPRAPKDPVAGGEARRHDHEHAVSTNAAFGGSNSALLFRRPRARDGGEPGHSAPGPLRPGRASLQSLFNDAAVVGRPVFIWGTGVARDDTAPLAGIDPRSLDAAGRLLTGAARAALDDAGVRVVGPLQERTGLMVGTTTLSPGTARAFWRTIDERGLDGLAARHFARMVLNAPTGAASRALLLKGTTNTLSTSRGSGLVAIALAARALGRAPSTPSTLPMLVVAGGLDERDREGQPQGCACVLLGAGPTVGTTPIISVHIIATALAAADDRVRASVVALARAGLVNVDVVVVADAADAAASSGALAVVRAVQRLRAGELTSALVLSAPGDGVACAIVLRALRPEPGDRA